nr:retrotransposon protein, putative, Ty1-copia subclass [Tanacetum cinerariifolium]
HPAKDDTCHHYKEVGHCKRNCLAYLAELIKKKKQVGTARLLRSTDDESFDQCVSCLSGNTTRKSFPYRPEKETDILGIIHTDVCGPLRHVSRQDVSYFITFTGDYSRYGYIYLLKHKHEVFETFRVFKNKVKNQLGKTIKALRSNRGGEYISQEFKDYLKACGIVQQIIPLYTPQHNGVSEKRNRTLLDMVRSIMNLATLLLSFWDYALESATRILNMVPTKKETMGCYFYFSPENKIVVARYAEFFEKKFTTQKVSGRAIDLEEIQDEDTSPSKITSEIPVDVKGYEPPQESKWRFKKKTDMDGIVHTYKARLVAKGYTQLYGVDYEETFLLVPDIRAIRILISIAAFYDYEIWQMDVKTAFLNGYLDEDIYMVQPEGEPHWTVVKIILKYLGDTKYTFLVYGRNPKAGLRVDCYCNAGFEIDIDDMKSQTEYVFILNGRRSRLEKFQVKYYCKACYIS